MSNRKTLKKFVKPKGRVTEAEARAMANALADALGIKDDEPSSKS